LLQTQTDAVEKHEKTPRNKQGRVTGHMHQTRTTPASTHPKSELSRTTSETTKITPSEETKQEIQESKLVLRYLGPVLPHTFKLLL